MTGKDIKNTLTEYALSIFMTISTLLVFILIGYLVKGLIQIPLIQDIVMIIFATFGLFLQFSELRYEFLQSIKGNITQIKKS